MTSPLGGLYRTSGVPRDGATIDRAPGALLDRPRLRTALASARAERRAPIREPFCSGARRVYARPVGEGRAPRKPSGGARVRSHQELVAVRPPASFANESVRRRGGLSVPVGHVEAHDRRSETPGGGGRRSVDHDHGERTRRGHK